MFQGRGQQKDVSMPRTCSSRNSDSKSNPFSSFYFANFTPTASRGSTVGWNKYLRHIHQLDQFDNQTGTYYLTSFNWITLNLHQLLLFWYCKKYVWNMAIFRWFTWKNMLILSKEPGFHLGSPAKRCVAYDGSPLGLGMVHIEPSRFNEDRLGKKKHHFFGINLERLDYTYIIYIITQIFYTYIYICTWYPYTI